MNPKVIVVVAGKAAIIVVRNRTLIMNISIFFRSVDVNVKKTRKSLKVGVVCNTMLWVGYSNCAKLKTLNTNM